MNLPTLVLMSLISFLDKSKASPSSRGFASPKQCSGANYGGHNERSFFGYQLLSIGQPAQPLDESSVARMVSSLETKVDSWTSIWSLFLQSNHYNSTAQHHKEADILVPPENLPDVTRILAEHGVPYRVKIVDVQKLIDKTKKLSGGRENAGFDRNSVSSSCTGDDASDQFVFTRDRLKRRSFRDWMQIVVSDFRSLFVPRPDPSEDRLLNLFEQSRQGNGGLRLIDQQRLVQEFPIMSWDQYHRLGVIYAYLHRLAMTYPRLARVVTIGRTAEGRDISLLQIGTRKDYRKPSIFVEAGIHGREWIAPATATIFLRELVENHQKNADILDTFDIFVLPVTNPDGYEYTHTANRLWRKNRSGAGGLDLLLPQCAGVDLNRNFNFDWGGLLFDSRSGTRSACTETFSGYRPFSERETRAVRDFVASLRGQHPWVMYFSLHSYGQKILYPWSSREEKVPDWRDLNQLGQIMANAIYQASNGQYTYEVGTSPEVNYYATGGSDDWARGKMGIKWVFLLELPDTQDSPNSSGFLLPPEDIEHVGLTTFIGFRAALEEIRKTIVRK